MNTAIYIRVSTNKQDTGLEAQLLAIEKYCKINNLCNYMIFKDNGISGTKRHRPELDKLMSEVVNKNVNRVICYSFSRFARSTSHLLSALETFKKHDVQFISITEQVDTSTHIGKLIFTILSSIAEFERDLICERVKTGLNNARSKGKILGRKLIRKSEDIRALYQKGLSYREIAKRLDCSIGTIHNELKGGV